MTQKQTQKNPEKCMIIAMTTSGLVGKGSGLPWKSSMDFKWFQKHTIGYPVLVGKNTALGMPRFPLKNRPCSVVSSKTDEPVIMGNNGIITAFKNVNDFYNAYNNFSKVFIAGGPGLYWSTKDLIDTVFQTIFPDTKDVEGDVYFDPCYFDINFTLVQSERYALIENADGKFMYILSNKERVKEDDPRMIIDFPKSEQHCSEPHLLKESDTKFRWITFNVWKRSR